MNIDTFIEIWDKRLNDWMIKPGDTLNKCLGEDSRYFQSQYMPEPYLGNPKHSSFVIVNLNPGQGRCHSWYELKDKIGTLINAVKRKNYSKIALKFPYLHDEKDLGLIKWEENEARKWWKRKENWIRYIYSNFATKTDFLDFSPFAIELNGWHSEKWPKSLTSKIKNNNKETNEIADIIYEAIDNSQFKFAYCVGKPIGDILKCKFQKEIPLNFEKERDGYRPILNIKRYYRVYHDRQGHCLINTWAQGSNSYPSKKFWPIEKDIIQQIKKLLRSE